MLSSKTVSKVEGYRQYTVLTPRSETTLDNVLCLDPFGICMLYTWDKRPIQLLAMMVDLDIPMTFKFVSKLTRARQHGGPGQGQRRQGQGGPGPGPGPGQAAAPGPGQTSTGSPAGQAIEDQIYQGNALRRIPDGGSSHSRHVLSGKLDRSNSSAWSVVAKPPHDLAQQLPLARRLQGEETLLHGRNVQELHASEVSVLEAEGIHFRIPERVLLAQRHCQGLRPEPQQHVLHGDGNTIADHDGRDDAAVLLPVLAQLAGQLEVHIAPQVQAAVVLGKVLSQRSLGASFGLLRQLLQWVLAHHPAWYVHACFGCRLEHHPVLHGEGHLASAAPGYLPAGQRIIVDQPVTPEGSR